MIGRAAARPYPARVAGTPRLFSWDAASGELIVEWEEDGSATGDTVVMTPSAVLGGGYDAMLDDGGDLLRAAAELTIPQRGGSRRLRLTAR